MDPRTPGHPLVRGVIRALERFNARHPWSHNDHFHGWILRNLPQRRRVAVDIGCGRGLLLTRLAPRFASVIGTETDPEMRAAAAARVGGLPNVAVEDAALATLLGLVGEADLVTMVAVLHHLDAEEALLQVRELLSPGGRLLVVGLAPPATASDLAWDLASTLANPLIGLAKHPRPHRGTPAGDPFPTRQPTMTFDELKALLARVMPGARMRHRLGFRHTIAWTKP